MLLKFLNLGSSFPLQNRLKPFFPFISKQPENTQHPASLILIQLVVNSMENGNISSASQRLISHCKRDLFIKIHLFIGVRIVVVSTERIAHPVWVAWSPGHTGHKGVNEMLRNTIFWAAPSQCPQNHHQKVAANEDLCWPASKFLQTLCLNIHFSCFNRF